MDMYLRKNEMRMVKLYDIK